MTEKTGCFVYKFEQKNVVFSSCCFLDTPRFAARTSLGTSCSSDTDKAFLRLVARYSEDHHPSRTVAGPWIGDLRKTRPCRHCLGEE